MRRFAEKLAFVALQKFYLERMQTYFRIEVEGIEHIPKRGKSLILPNHSGCSGLDAAMLWHTLNNKFQRIPRILALWTYFKWIPPLGVLAKKLGLTQASFKAGVELLQKNHITIVFPEGEAGSFKPSSERYRLRPFHTGFVRMAVLSKAPVVPCVIIGAEEANINLGSIHLEKYVKGLTVPLPFNLVPLPAKWKIRFLPPVHFGHFTRQDSNDKLKMQIAADEIKATMQRMIDFELLKRNYVYFGNNSYLDNRALLLEKKTG